jgi:hypothetical protein
VGHTPPRKRRCQDFDVSGKFAISAAFSITQAILDVVPAGARTKEVKDEQGSRIWVDQRCDPRTAAR